MWSRLSARFARCSTTFHRPGPARREPSARRRSLSSRATVKPRTKRVGTPRATTTPTADHDSPISLSRADQTRSTWFRDARWRSLLTTVPCWPTVRRCARCSTTSVHVPAVRSRHRRSLALAPQPPKTPTYAGSREWSAGGRVRSRHDPDRHRGGVCGDAGCAGGRAGGGVPDGGDDGQPRAAARADDASRTCRPTRSTRRRTGSARSTPTSRSRRRRRSRGWPRPWLPYDATTGGSCWSPASTRPTHSCTSTTSASTSTSSRDGSGGPARATC